MVRTILGLSLVLIVSSTSAWGAAPPIIDGESFTFPLPDGYHEVTEQISKAGFPRKQVTVEAKLPSKGYRPTIMFALAPIWGGTLGDLKVCEQTAKSFAGANGKVRNAAIISAPTGKVCQMHIVAPQGIALMTELISYSETWVMTCNHADGDAAAEKVCRATLAAFKFKEPRRAPPKIALPHTGVRECDEYLGKFVACLSQRLSDADFAPTGVLLKQTAEAMKKSAESEEGRKSLPAVCTQTLAATKRIVRVAACEW
jgi:hypothetical protein